MEESTVVPGLGGGGGDFMGADRDARAAARCINKALADKVSGNVVVAVLKAVFAGKGGGSVAGGGGTLETSAARVLSSKIDEKRNIAASVRGPFAACNFTNRVSNNS